MEDEKQLRQLLRKARQLPEPDWNLFSRTTKRWSKLRPARLALETQQREMKPKRKPIKKVDDKVTQSSEK